MHELGLLNQVIRTVDDVMHEQGLTQLSEIVLSVGEMTDVVPAYLEEAWQTLRTSTPYPDATLTVEIVPATARCNDCGYESGVSSFGMTCPQCDSPRLTVVSGREFNIKHIVAG